MESHQPPVTQHEVSLHDTGDGRGAQPGIVVRGMLYRPEGLVEGQQVRVRVHEKMSGFVAEYSVDPATNEWRWLRHPRRAPGGTA